MLISGGLAGLGGAMEGLGNFQNMFVQGAMPAVGSYGTAVALLGIGSSIGILALLLFSTLKIGGTSMPLMSGVPEIVDIVIVSIIFFVGASYIIRLSVNKLPKVNKKEVVREMDLLEGSIYYRIFGLDLLSAFNFHRPWRNFQNGVVSSTWLWKARW